MSFLVKLNDDKKQDETSCFVFKISEDEVQKLLLEKNEINEEEKKSYQELLNILSKKFFFKKKNKK